MKIAIASGKGGTGKTTVAVNLYHTIAKFYKQKVSLVDCDVEEPNVALFFPERIIVEQKPVELPVPKIDVGKCTFCRKCVEYCEFNAITVIPPLCHAEIATDLCHSCGACLHACKFDAIAEFSHEIGTMTRFDLKSGRGLTEGRLKVGSVLQTPVIRKIKKASNNYGNIIIYDAPPGTSCSVVSTISDTDFVILVTEPTPFGLHDLKLAVSLVRALNVPFGVVINKAGMGNDAVERFLEGESIMTIEKIPFDKEIARLYSGNEMLAETFPEYEKHFIKIFEKINKILNPS